MLSICWSEIRDQREELNQKRVESVENDGCLLSVCCCGNFRNKNKRVVCFKREKQTSHMCEFQGLKQALFSKPNQMTSRLIRCEWRQIEEFDRIWKNFQFDNALISISVHWVVQLSAWTSELSSTLCEVEFLRSHPKWRAISSGDVSNGDLSNGDVSIESVESKIRIVYFRVWIHFRSSKKFTSALTTVTNRRRLHWSCSLWDLNDFLLVLQAVKLLSAFASECLLTRRYSLDFFS